MMRVKVLILGLICFFIFICCKEKIGNPHSNNPSESLLLPTINYFNVVNQRGNVFGLSWGTTNATTVEIDQGIGEVSTTGLIEYIQVFETITYTLVATNNDGQTKASATADLSGRAILEITTIPEVPVFYYYSGFDNSQSTFTIVVTETNGVGGYFHYTTGFDTGCCGWSLRFKQSFEAFGIKSSLVNACAKQRPTTMILWLEGYDDNGYEIDMQVHVPVILEN